MHEEDVYSIHPHYRDAGTLILPATPNVGPPLGILRTPGYQDKVREVQRGLRAPFWGEDYTQDAPGRLADLVDADFLQCAASDALRQILDGVEGVSFHPIRVDGKRTMYLLGVAGLVGLNPAPLKLKLLDGAEAGIYEHTFIHVNARIARRIRDARLDMDVEPAVVFPGFPGSAQT